MKRTQKLTRDDIWEMFAETSKQFKETDQRIAKMNEETTQYLKQSNDDANQRLDKLAKLVGGIGNSNGELAEEYFYNAFYRDRTFVNEKFDSIKRNFTYRGEGDDLKAEYDIFLFNGKSAAIIEVKYNAKAENIEIDKLISRIGVFKIWFPEYKNHNIYLGVAAMSFKKDIVWQLHRAGIATIRPIGKKMMVYDKRVKVF